MENKSQQNTHTDAPIQPSSGRVQKQIDMNAPIGLGENLKKGKKEGVFDVTKAFENPNSETGVFVSDKRKTGPSIGESFISAISEWWGEGNTSKTPAEVSIQNVPPKAPTKALSATPQRAEIIAEIPVIAGKIERKPEEQKPETAQTEIVHPHHHAVIEKTRTFKKDVARLTESNDDEDDLATESTERKDTPSTSKVTPPKAVRMGPLTVPDVRTATIAPLVQMRTEMPTIPPKKAIPEEPTVRAQQVSVPSVTPRPPVERATQSFIHQEPAVATTQSVERAPEPFEPQQTFIAPVTSHEPVKHAELFNKEESIVDTAITDELPALEDKLEFHSTLDQTLLERRKSEVLRSQRKNVKSSPAWVSLLQETSTSWMALFVLILLGAITAIVASVYIHMSQNSNETPPVPFIIPSFFETEAQTTVLLSEDGPLFLTTLEEHIRTAKPGVVQLYPTTFENGVERSVTSSEFFTTIHATLDEVAIRTLDDTIMLGSVTTLVNEPYLILRTNDFDTLFSAFLLWEQTMQADLSPLFGVALSSQATFSDSVWNNRSTRILTGAEGQTVLLYSFVNQNTVVITQSEEALSILLEKF